jgi:hypothetical protein
VPTVDFKGLVTMMVDADVERLKGSTPQAENRADRSVQHR